MIKGAIFDVDGTLLDSMKIWDEAGARYLKSQGRKAAKDLAKTLFPMTVEESAEYLIKNYSLDIDKIKVQEGILDTVDDFYRYEVSCKTGAEEMLQKIRKAGIPAVAATTSNIKHITYAFERLDLMKYFDRIFTCSQIGAGKTEPDIFNAAAEYMGTYKEDTYVFEDGVYAVKTASNAGFMTVGIYDDSSDESWEEMKAAADFTMYDLRQFDLIWEKIRF